MTETYALVYTVGGELPRYNVSAEKRATLGTSFISIAPAIKFIRDRAVVCPDLMPHEIYDILLDLFCPGMLLEHRTDTIISFTKIFPYRKCMYFGPKLQLRWFSSSSYKARQLLGWHRTTI